MRCMFWFTQVWLLIGCMSKKTTNVAPVDIKPAKQSIVTSPNMSTNNVDDTLLVFGALLVGVIMCVVIVNLLNSRKK